MHKQNTAIFIPARINSTRFPKKILYKIGDQSLIEHVIDRARESGIENIFLATDSKEIISAVQNKKIETILTNPAHNSGSDRIYEALQMVDPDAKYFTNIINLQGDLPFINPSMIKLLKTQIENSNSDIATLVAPIKDSDKINDVNIVKVAINFCDSSCQSGPKSGQAVYFSRQAIPSNADIYYEHIGIYAYKRQALEKFIAAPRPQLEMQESLEQLRAYSIGLHIEAYQVDFAPVGVDTLEDLKKLVVAN